MQYIKTPDGRFIEAPTTPAMAALTTFAAAAASETNLHEAAKNIGSQIPAVVPLMGIAVAAFTPDAVQSIVESVATGNPLAIAGTLVGTLLTGYSTFTKTQLKGVTNEQIKAAVLAMSPDELNGLLNPGATVTSIANPGSKSVTGL